MINGFYVYNDINAFDSTLTFNIFTVQYSSEDDKKIFPANMQISR